MALELIKAHIEECRQMRRDYRDSARSFAEGTKAAIDGLGTEMKGELKEVRTWLVGFVMAVFGVVVIFGGYEYTQNEAAAQQRNSLVQVVRQSAAQTQQAVKQQVAPPAP